MDRRQGERRSNVYPLQDKDTRLRFAAKAAGFGIYDLDCETGDMYWSPELRAMAGLAPEDAPLSRDEVLLLVHPDDRHRLVEAMEASLDPATAEGLEVEFRLLRPDGAVRWTRAVGNTFFIGEAEERHPLMATGIVMDMSPSRETENALRQSRAELAGLIDSVIDAIISIDADQRIVLFNPAACRMFRCPVDKAIGAPLEHFIPERSRAAHREHVRRFADNGVTARTMGEPGVFCGLRADGEEFPIEASISKVQVGGQWRMTVFVRDITERKRWEEELLRMNEQLESRIAERTAELVESNEALARSNLDLQQFAYVAAHDLQTPLRSVIGFAQLFHKEYRGRLDPQADTWLDQLLKSAQRMYELIQDLLAYSRVDSQGGPFRPTDMRSLLADVLTALDAAIRETGAKVRCDGLPTVMGDRMQLAQLLQNLIGNGIKYHGASPPEIDISAGRRDGEWLFAVRDNGIGIAEKHHERIFEIFYRLHTQQDYPGTGIGLAVCRRVVHRHGGRIWVESRPGAGSTFYFTLPDKDLEGE